MPRARTSSPGLRALACGALACAVVATLAAAGCRKAPPPIATEKARVVRVGVAPALAEPAASSVAGRALSWGEVYQAGSTRADFHWQGMFEGRREQRVGLVELARTKADAPRFGFEPDLLEADVPTSAWLCAQLKGSAIPREACADRLLRIVPADGVMIAFVPTWRGDSPLLELREGAVHEIALPAISRAQVVSLDKRPAVLLWSHWSRGRDWTGSELVVLLPSPPLQRAGQLSLGETDARDAARVTYFRGALEILADGLRVSGRRSVRDRRTDVELSGTEVDERWGLGADGKLQRR